MQNLISTKRAGQRKYFGFYASLLVLIALCSHTLIQNRAVPISGKHTCAGKSKETKTLANFNDMLFSFGSLIIADMENSDGQ